MRAAAESRILKCGKFLVFLCCFISPQTASYHTKYCMHLLYIVCILYAPVIPCVCVCVCACMYFCSPWRYIIFSQPPFFHCHSSSDNQRCSSFSGLSCGPTSSDQGPRSAEDNLTHCAQTRETDPPTPPSA